MLIFIPTVALGLFFCLFLFWKRLKEDYSQDVIFNTIFMFLIAGAFVLLLSNFYFPDYWFWSVILSSFILARTLTKKYRLKFFETLDALIISSLSLLLFFSTSKALAGNAEYFFMAIICLLLIMFFFFIDKRYKKFLWYKSGKIGFAGLSTASIFFATIASIAILAPGMVFLNGIVDAIVASILVLICMFSLFKLSKRT